MMLSPEGGAVGDGREQDGEKILVAVAWPYASGPRHIGHVAGFGVPSDIFARYHRLEGNDVLMVSGTDEHGTPVMVAAEKEGLSPRELADRYNEVIRDDLRRLGLSYDIFTRTTTRNHYRVVRDRLPHAAREGLHRRADRDGRLLGLDAATRCPTATSRAPARTAATARRAATSATTAGASSTRPT